MDNWVGVNRALWDERAAPHASSPDYEVERFIADPGHLSAVVTFDRERLGDIAGMRGVHLQCHIGTDTLSLHRLGARMTGLDFSPAALDQARALATSTRAEIEYGQATVDDALDVLPKGAFDLVYTGIGALCWLPEIKAWAAVVAGLLRPGGRLFLREGHPVLWALDEDVDGLVLRHPYFEQLQPTVFDSPGTYVEVSQPLQQSTSVEWNHGLGEIVTALFEAGLRITMLVEHDSVPWEALPRQMERLPNGEYRLRDRPERVPLSYTLQATRT